jgi:hypothetical protein
MIGFTPNPVKTEIPPENDNHILKTWYQAVSNYYSSIFTESLSMYLPTGNHMESLGAEAKIKIVTLPNSTTIDNLTISVLFPVGFVNTQLAEQRAIVENQIISFFNSHYNNIQRDVHDLITTNGSNIIKEIT